MLNLNNLIQFFVYFGLVHTFDLITLDYYILQIYINLFLCKLFIDCYNNYNDNYNSNFKIMRLLFRAYTSTARYKCFFSTISILTILNYNENK